APASQPKCSTMSTETSSSPLSRLLGGEGYGEVNYLPMEVLRVAGSASRRQRSSLSLHALKENRPSSRQSGLAHAFEDVFGFGLIPLAESDLREREIGS